MKTNENGRSMIEMLGVLAIIGVLSVGGFSLVNKMYDSYETNQIIDVAGELASKTRTVVRDYDIDETSKKNSSMNEYLCNGKAVPDIFLSEEFGDCKDMNGSGSITYNVQYLGDRVMYVVQVSGVSEETCMQFVTTNWGTPGSSGFMGLSVGNNAKSVNSAITSGSKGSEKVALAGSSDYPAPMSIGTAANACDGDGLTINLSYR